MSDRIRSSLEWVLQQLIEAEATAVIGAGPHECTETRTAQRNGRRPRLLSTPADDVELEIPKLWQGSFFPSLLERCRRIDRALFAVVMDAYVHGGLFEQPEVTCVPERVRSQGVMATLRRVLVVQAGVRLPGSGLPDAHLDRTGPAGGTAARVDHPGGGVGERPDHCHRGDPGIDRPSVRGVVVTGVGLDRPRGPVPGGGPRPTCQRRR